jgi:hypothetical protein
MLTVTLMLSGPHRQAMLATAFDSIPIESSAVSEVVVRHQNGPWNWGGALRERILAHPKVRLVEFPDRVDWAPSFNRTLDLVRTPWALMLPDDDFLVRLTAKSAFERAAADRQVDDVGFVAFGWYYLKDGRYVANRFHRPGLPAVLSCTPKFCTTMFNIRRVRELGGFNEMGGFVDAELLGRLACEFDAVIAPARVGVYRMHEGQESARMQAVYAPYVDAMRSSLGRYARDSTEREAFERELSHFVAPRTKKSVQLIKELGFQLRSRGRPVASTRGFRMRKWSSG